MIRRNVSGDPFSADETVLGLFHAALNDMRDSGRTSCTAVVTFGRANNVKARFVISLVKDSTGASRRKPPRMTRRK